MLTPSELALRLARIPLQYLYFRRPEVARIYRDDCLSRLGVDTPLGFSGTRPFHAQSEGLTRTFDEFANLHGPTGGQHIVIRFVSL